MNELKEVIEFNQSHFTKIILQILGLSIAVLLSIVAWYLNSINGNIKELSNSISSVNTTTVLLNAKIEQIDSIQKLQHADYKELKGRIADLEKNR